MHAANDVFADLVVGFESPGRIDGDMIYDGDGARDMSGDGLCSLLLVVGIDCAAEMYSTEVRRRS